MTAAPAAARRRRLAAGAGACLVLLLGAPPASADSVVAPVEDIQAPVVDLVFSEATLDGALTDTGHRQFRLAADVLFAFDRADLTSRAGVLLAQVAGTVRSQAATRLTVTGYTDSVGAPAYNLDLSRRRAHSVASALQTALGPGVAVSESGMGETHPVATNDTGAGRALNRRVEIRLG